MARFTGVLLTVAVVAAFAADRSLAASLVELRLSGASAEVISADDQFTLPVWLYDAANVVAVELSARCSSDSLRIADVTYDAAFSRVLTENAAQLPARTYYAVRARGLDSLAPPESAGTSGLQAAVITLEVTTDAPFQEYVEVTVHAIVAGPLQEPTTIRTADGRESASGTIRGAGTLDDAHLSTPSAHHAAGESPAQARTAVTTGSGS